MQDLVSLFQPEKLLRGGEEDWAVSEHSDSIEIDHDDGKGEFDSYNNEGNEVEDVDGCKVQTRQGAGYSNTDAVKTARGDSEAITLARGDSAKQMKSPTQSKPTTASDGQDRAGREVRAVISVVNALRREVLVCLCDWKPLRRYRHARLFCRAKYGWF